MITFRGMDSQDLITAVKGAFSLLDSVAQPQVGKYMRELESRNVPGQLAAAGDADEFAAAVRKTGATTMLSKLAPLLRQKAALDISLGKNDAVKVYNTLIEFGMLDPESMPSDTHGVGPAVNGIVQTENRIYKLQPFYKELAKKSGIERYSLVGLYNGLAKHQKLVDALVKSGDITQTSVYGTVTKAKDSPLGTIFHGTQHAAHMIAAAQSAETTETPGERKNARFKQGNVIRYLDGRKIKPVLA